MKLNLLDDIAPDRKFEVPNGCGVVTSGQRLHFPGVQLLYTSLVRTHANLPLVLWEVPGDLLTDEQRGWCDRQPMLTVKALPEEALVAPADHQAWWNKPAMLKHAPFERSLWLDADTIVLRSLEPVFRHMTTHPFFVVANPYPGNNKPELLNYIDVADKNENFTVNTSCCGLDNRNGEHRQVVETWCDLMRFITHHPENLSGYVSNVDEGVMRVTLQKLGMTHIPWPDQHWSWSLWYPSGNRNGCLIHDTSNLLARFPHEHVLHFPCFPKPWTHSGLSVIDIDPHAGCGGP